LNLSLANLPTLNQIRAERARRRLQDFTTYTYPDYEANWHHQKLCEYLERWAFGDIDRLMVFMPPRNGKSELVSRRLPAFIFGHEPDASIIATSYGSDLASRMNRDVQRIIDSPSYHAIFPDTTLNGSNVRTVANGSYLRNSDIFEIVNHKGVYKSSGVGGAITGMGMKFGIIDDPYKNRQDANSQTVRESIWDWYVSTFYTRLEKGGKVLITLTRWHEDDLAGRLLKLARSDPSADQWVVVNFPAIAEGDLHEDDPREEGDPLWPAKYPLKELLKIKATVGSYEWNALFQQRPSPAGGNIFNRSWWKYYKVLPNRFDELIQSWDCTFKDNKDSDYVVGQVWGRIGADKYLIDQVRDKMNFPTTVQAIRNLTAKYPETRAKYIEDKANGSAIIQTLSSEINGIIAVNPDGGKIARAQAVSPDVEAGNVYLPDPSIAPWINDFVEEATSFPNGAHDDQVDGMTQAVNQINKRPLPNFKKDVTTTQRTPFTHGLHNKRF
jgi:predicted phage terminase large subunit-like protein